MSAFSASNRLKWQIVAAAQLRECICVRCAEGLLRESPCLPEPMALNPEDDHFEETQPYLHEDLRHRKQPTLLTVKVRWPCNSRPTFHGLRYDQAGSSCYGLREPTELPAPTSAGSDFFCSGLPLRGPVPLRPRRPRGMDPSNPLDLAQVASKCSSSRQRASERSAEAEADPAAQTSARSARDCCAPAARGAAATSASSFS